MDARAEIAYQYILQKYKPNIEGLKIRVAYLLYLTEVECFKIFKSPFLFYYIKRAEGPIQKDLVQELSDKTLSIKPINDEHLEYFSSLEMQCISNVLIEHGNSSMSTLETLVKGDAYSKVFYSDFLSIKDIATEAGLNKCSLEYINTNLYLTLSSMKY